MKRKETDLLITLALGLGLIGALFWVLGGGSTAQAAGVAEERVCLSGCPYSSVQAAVDAAVPGSLIKVAEGTYTDIHAREGVTQVVYLTKTVTIRGGYTTTNWLEPDPEAHPSVLDAGGQGRVLFITGYGDITVQGLHLTGGDAKGLRGDPWGEDAGGGIYVNVTEALIQGNRIYENAAYRGAGVFLNYAHGAQLVGNRVISNTAADMGGGLYLAYSDAVLRANAVLANEAVGWKGGGLVLNGSEATLVNNVVADNVAGWAGSAMFLYSCSPRLVHTTIARNRGGDGTAVEIAHTGSPEAVSSVRLTNTIVFSQVTGIMVKEHNTATLNATLWYGNATDWDGLGTILTARNRSGNPLFAADGYHLTKGSAAIDEGVATLTVLDIDGEERPMGGGYDLGADEFVAWRLFLPVAVRDGP